MPFLARGVHRAPYLSDAGQPVLVAVTRSGRLLGEPVPIPDDDAAARIERDLWNALDAADPVPDLKVI